LAHFGPVSRRVPAVRHAKVDKLNHRLIAVERLSLIHNNYLQDQLQKNPPMPPADDAHKPQ
jgi:hypothetical protein